MIIETTAIADGILMAAFFLRQIVLMHLKFADYFVLDIVLDIKQSEENVILI